MPRRLRNGISNSARREMAKTISRFAMSEHADLTFGTKESCLDGTQTTRKLGGGRAEPIPNANPPRNAELWLISTNVIAGAVHRSVAVYSGQRGSASQRMMGRPRLHILPNGFARSWLVVGRCYGRGAITSPRCAR
jgi:hypothetical protein